MRRKPNVVYILGDDQRAEYLGCMGHPYLKTPNLDNLADSGTLFTDAFCTSPVCTPSRTCHYLGQWERRHGINFNSHSAVREDAWAESLPMVLKRNGYTTAWVGKNHMPVGKGGYGGGTMERDFDYWYGNHGHSFFYVKEYPGGSIYKNSDFDTQIEVFTQGALNFLQHDEAFSARHAHLLPPRDTEKPFFLAVTFNLPHDCGTFGMQMRPGDDELYKSAYREHFNSMPLPSTYMSQWSRPYKPKLPKDVYNGVRIPYYDYVDLPEAMREKIIRTCQTITGMDRFVGCLVDALKQTGEYENTIIVFSTDHGIHFGEFGLGGKSLLYEPDLRIPLIISDPRRRGDVHKTDALAVVPDIAPTVLDLCGIDIPQSMQGSSLTEVMRGGAGRAEFFAESLMDTQNYPRSECVRSREWKYIRYFKRTEDPVQADDLFKGTLDDYLHCLNSTSFLGEQPIYEELYHLKTDPEERYNVAEDWVNQPILSAFREKIVAHAQALKGNTDLPKTVSFINNL